MPEPLVILPLGNHGNVGSELRGSSLFPVGYARGCIALELQRKSAPVDVSAHGVLRLQLALTAMHGSKGYENGRLDASSLHVEIEHLAPDGRWKSVHRFKPMKDIGTQHCVLGSFGSQIRASYYHARQGQPGEAIKEGVAFEWSLMNDAAAAAQPEQ